MSWLVAISISIALVASLGIVPLVRFAARRVGMVDHPDQNRKLHSAPVALGGGLAVFTAFVIAFVATILIDRAFFDYTLGTISRQWYVLFTAAGAIMLVGLIDDRWMLRGRQKLLLQCLIVAALVGSGTVINSIGLFGYKLDLGVFAFPVTVVWLLVAINALNLIDGADGMATTAGGIICLGLGCLSLQSGATFTAIVGFGLAGALAGFLVFNRPPASIYLGDAGSMMIGLFVGVLACWTNLNKSTFLASAPIAILAIPLVDSGAAILRRWLTGRSIYVTDRGHLHHLLQRKYGNRKMLLIVAAACGTTTMLAVMSVYFRQSWLAGFGVVLVVLMLVLSRSFGHSEARLLLNRTASFAQSFATSPTRLDTDRQHRSISLQGVGDWDTIWEPLIAFAVTHDLARIKIDLNLVWLHEGYHANWQSMRLPDKEYQLNLSVPLFTPRANGEQTMIGRLEVMVPANHAGAYEKIADLTDKLADLSPEIDRIVAKLELVHEDDLQTATTGEGSEPVSPLSVGSESELDDFAPARMQ